MIRLLLRLREVNPYVSARAIFAHLAAADASWFVETFSLPSGVRATRLQALARAAYPGMTFIWVTGPGRVISVAELERRLHAALDAMGIAP